MGYKTPRQSSAECAASNVLEALASIKAFNRRGDSLLPAPLALRHHRMAGSALLADQHAEIYNLHLQAETKRAEGTPTTVPALGP